ncbi:hypothetical protein V6N13_134088 [Hibiscus sabdariffa]
MGARIGAGLGVVVVVRSSASVVNRVCCFGEEGQKLLLACCGCCWWQFCELLGYQGLGKWRLFDGALGENGKGLLVQWRLKRVEGALS